ncbi:MAG TPA: GatB/YqeY domain-containing protein [Bauldia sp.]|nr:GatB/YqeY domain-containing protein [Bauldia sp.]
MIRERIADETKTAMKGGDKARLSTLRMVASSIKNAEIEARTSGKGDLTDEALLPLLQKLIKQRQESADLYDKGARPELAANERAEIDVIQSFLPQQMSDDEVRTAIAAAIKEASATTAKDMGKVMATLKTKYAGKMDFAKASGTVKGMLG